jgi:predicted CopG family antitoxin
MKIVRGVKVHDDTHRVLKQLKEQRRSRSMDEVIRDLVRGATGRSVEQLVSQKKRNTRLTTFIE